MKIKCSKVSEVLKQQADAWKEYSDNQAEYNSQYQEYRSSYSEFEAAIKSSVKSLLSSVKLPLKIEVSQGWRSMGSTVKVYLPPTESSHGDTALSWSYQCSLNLDTKEVIRETSSWSGLQATTAAQLDNLKESVKAIELLNNADWANILDSEPVYDDFVHTYPSQKPDFEEQLAYATIEDAIGSTDMFLGRPYNIAGKKSYYQILSETPKNYNVQEIASDNPKMLTDYRIAKSKLLSLLDKPVQCVDNPF